MDQQRYWWLMPLSIIVSALIIVAGFATGGRAILALYILGVLIAIPLLKWICDGVRGVIERKKLRREARQAERKRMAELSGQVPSNFS